MVNRVAQFAENGKAKEEEGEPAEHNTQKKLLSQLSEVRKLRELPILITLRS